MKIVATLACRNNSTRLYGKPLQLLGKLSILEYIVTRLSERNEVQDIVLAISEARGNEAFIEVAEKHNLKYVTGDDRDVLARLIKACDHAGGDVVYRVTTEDPFHYLEGLPRAIESHVQNKAAYTAYAGLPDGSTFELIQLDALKTSHRDGERKHRSELCSLYIREHPELFKMNVLNIEKEWERNYRLTIDYPEDLILCRKIMANFTESSYIPYKELVTFLDKNPELPASVENLDDHYRKYLKPVDKVL